MEGFSIRNRAYYRDKRRKAINKKIRIIKIKYSFDFIDSSKREPGRLSKAKVHCSCKMCKFEKFYGIERYNYLSKLEAIKNELNLMEQEYPMENETQKECYKGIS